MTEICQIQNRKIGQLANFSTEKISLAAMQGFFYARNLGKPLARTTVRKARFHVQRACQFLFFEHDQENAMKMVAQPQTVFFHNTQLSIIEHNNQPYVPMKLVVEGMGLDWKSQHRKLASNPRWGMVKMTIPSSGGIQEMLCIPLRKLFGWFNSISANKVKPECKEAVIKYQEECDDVLWNHWTGKLNARHKAFDELNKIDMDEKISKAKATLHSHGLHLRKAEKKTNKQKRQDWINKNTLLLNFGEEGLA